MWYVDQRGGTGKSLFAGWLAATADYRVCHITAGRAQDVLYSYGCERVVLRALATGDDGAVLCWDVPYGVAKGTLALEPPANKSPDHA